MTELYTASTVFGLMTLAAAIDATTVGAPNERRVLLVSNNAAIPEVTQDLRSAPGAGALLARFDQVELLNDLIAPMHPTEIETSPSTRPFINRLVRDRLGLNDSSTIVTESIHVRPNRTLVDIFDTSPITTYADGLMAYGPTRDRLSPEVGNRIDALAHLDLLPGLKPRLLREFDVPAVPIPDDAFRAVVDELAEAADSSRPARPFEGAPYAMCIGQYLAALDILTPLEEERLHIEMIDAAAVAGLDRVVFKAHPTAPPTTTEPLFRHAESRSVRLELARPDLPLEVLAAYSLPELVVGCFSTGLATMSKYFEVGVAHVGTELLVERLTPFENSNRVPVSLINELVANSRSLSETGPRCVAPVQDSTRQLLDTLAYTMQPTINDDLHDAAQTYLKLPDARLDLFKKRRLTVLNLPGGVPVPGGLAGKIARIRTRIRRKQRHLQKRRRS